MLGPPKTPRRYGLRDREDSRFLHGIEDWFRQLGYLLAESLRSVDADSASPPLDTLEPRIMLSASPIAAAIDNTELPQATTTEGTHATGEQAVATEATSLRRELIVIDSRVQDPETLQAGLQDDPARALTVVQLAGDEDGLARLHEALDAEAAWSAVHLVTHAEEGAIQLGNRWVDGDAIEALAASGAATNLTADADLLLYGCDLADDPAGLDLIAKLADWTGADIAASNDATGHADYAGDWVLEYQQGNIETGVFLSEAGQSAWLGKLATITVDTFDDELSNNGLTSLREAILQASDGDVLQLAAGTYQLTILGTGEDDGQTGDLNIDREITIIGQGMGQTIIDALGQSRVIDLTGESSKLTLRGLTLRGGQTDGDGGAIRVTEDNAQLTLQQVRVMESEAIRGAGIFNRGQLTATDVVITANGDLTGTSEGGGLYNDGEATLERVSLVNNRATDGAGIYHHADNDSLRLTNVTLSGNVADNEGGGLYARRQVTVQSSTITANEAFRGGGIRSENGLEIANSIVADNTASAGPADIRGNFDSLDFNLFGRVNGRIEGNDFRNTSPDLLELANNGGFVPTHALSPNSVARDAGTFANAPYLDARGLQPTDGRRDIGAYQAVSAVIERLYWTIDAVNGSIQSANVDGSDVQTVLAGLNSPDHLVIDAAAEKLYWSSSQAGTIERANLDGTDTEVVLSGLVVPQGLAIDTVNETIFWVSNGTLSDGIFRANFDGSNVQSIISIGSVSSLFGSPDQIVLDVEGEELYWSDTLSNRLFRANMDGSDARRILDLDGTPRGIHFDPYARLLYWSEESGSDEYALQSVAVDELENDREKNAEKVETFAEDFQGTPAGLTLTYSSDTAYVTDAGGDRIIAYDVETESQSTVISTPPSHPKGIALGPAVPNAPPIVDSGGPYAIAEGEALTLDASGTLDPEHAPLTFAWDLDQDQIYGGPNEPASSNAELDWETLSNFGIANDGPFTIGLRVQDTHGNLVTETTTLTVSNIAPTLTSATSETIQENRREVQTVAATDPNDQVTYSISGGADASLFQIDGTSGVLQFATAPDFEDPRDHDQDNHYEVVVMAFDGTDSTSQTVTVEVTDVNEAPTLATLDDVTMDEDSDTVSIHMAVTDPDTAPAQLTATATTDNDALINVENVVISAGATPESAVLTFDLTPLPNAYGDASITLSVSDGALQDAQAFEVTVEAVNDRPVAADDRIEAVASSRVEFTVDDLVSNDFDVETDVLVPVLISPSPEGQLFDLGEGNLAFVFNPDSTAETAELTYAASDGELISEPATVQVRRVVDFIDNTQSPSVPNGEAANVAETPTDYPADGSGDADAEAATATETNEDRSEKRSEDVDEAVPEAGRESQPTASEPQPDAALIASDQSGETSVMILNDHQGGDVVPGLFAPQPENRGGETSAAPESIRGESQASSRDSSGTTENATTSSSSRMGFSLDTVTDLNWEAQSILRQANLDQTIDTIERQVQETSRPASLTIGASVTATTTMTVGYVIWGIRGGILLSSVMANLPMWRLMDPMAILSASDSLTEDEESLQEIVTEDPSPPEDERREE